MIFKEVRGTATARNDADRLDWRVTTEDAMLRELQFESLRTFESERAVGVFDYLFRHDRFEFGAGIAHKMFVAAYTLARNSRAKL